jgi:hypothetical protein
MSGMIDKIAVLGREFTIQTEHVPGPAGKIRTLVYDGGRLVTSRESATSAPAGADVDELVHQQHTLITETLVKRANELAASKTETPRAPRQRPATSQPPPPIKKPARPEVEPGSPLETAIAIRQTIGPFGLAFADATPATAAGYERWLESVDAAIDAIRDAPSYSAIRLDEQLTMIALKAQIQTWKLSDKDLGLAIELWPTIQSFALHLQKINHRGDLVEFDHRLLTWAMAELGTGSISGGLVAALHGLAGRDAELDSFLRNPAAAQPMELLEILLRLIDQTLA